MKHENNWMSSMYLQISKFMGTLELLLGTYFDKKLKSGKK